MTLTITRKHKLIAAALSLALLAGSLTLALPLRARAVEINATEQGFYRLAYGDEGATAFVSGSSIRVINQTRDGKSKSDAIYTTADGTTWTTDTGMLWEGDDDNVFLGVYPADAAYDRFTIPTDQSSGVYNADWMTAAYTGAASDGTVDLTFKHLLSKVTVTVTTWDSEYDGRPKEISAPGIYTLATSMEKNGADEAECLTAALTKVIPSATGEDQPAYTAIICPGTYTEGQAFMTFTVNGEDTHTVRAGDNQALTVDGLEPGKHYSFTLTVGKDAVLLSEVTVTPWLEEEIQGGVAEEVTGGSTVPALGINGTAMTDEELYAAVADRLAAGTTDLGITLVAEPTLETLTAVRRAICDAAVADGSIHLTLNGVQVVPDCETDLGHAFGYKSAGEETVTALASIRLPHVLYIGGYAFEKCTLTSLYAPALQTIGAYAFRGSGLTSVTVPAGVTSIGEHAFESCSQLAVVDIAPGSRLESIGRNAFEGTAITTITIPSGLTTISDQLFLNCQNLTTAEIPAQVTSIGKNAFKNCVRLTSVTLKANQVVSCTLNSFYQATALTAIYVPADLVEAYKAEKNWKESGLLIQPIPAES